MNHTHCDRRRHLAEAHIVQRIFRSRSVRADLAVADDGRTLQYFVTPFAAVYRLKIRHEQNISGVVSLAEDIASFINVFRRENGLAPREQTATVRIDGVNQCIEISRIERDVLYPEEIDWQPAPFTAMLGQSQDFQGTFPVTWNLASPDQPHALLAGTTGSGKTNQLLQIIISLTQHNGPEDLRLTIIDAKPSPDLRTVETLPHVDGVARDEENALRVIRGFHQEMARRYESFEQGVRRLLIVEELATLTESRNKTFQVEFRSKLEDISRRCREANMNLLVVTQKPNSDVLGPQLKSNLQVRLVGAVTSKTESNTAVNLKAAGAEMLPGRGAMICRIGRTLRTFQAPIIDDADAEFRRIAGTPGQGEVQPGDRVMIDLETGTIEPDMDRLSGGYGPGMQAGKPDIELDITGYIRGNGQYPAENGRSGLLAFPLGGFRPLSKVERDEVRRLSGHDRFQWKGRPSVNRLSLHVYGSKSPERAEEIKRALQERERMEAA